MIMLRLRGLVAGVIQEGRVRSPISYVGFVVYKVALVEGFLLVVHVSLSIPFHQCTILILMNMFLLPEHQRAKTGTSKKHSSFENPGLLDRKLLSTYIHERKSKEEP
jgi:hypothetical protein